MSEKRILIVEQSRHLAQLLEEYFSQSGPRYHVLSADSVPEAVTLISNSVVDLVLSEHLGPGLIDGLELLDEIRRMDRPVRSILIAPNELRDDWTTALFKGCAGFLVEPLDEERLTDLLFSMLNSQQGFVGRVVEMRIEDVIQLFCYRKESTLISVRHDDTLGFIYIVDGGIAHAECDSIDGVDAFFEILGWDSGEFASQVVLDVPERTVFVDWQSLLMEGVRQKDEIRHALGPVEAVESSSAALAARAEAGTWQMAARPGAPLQPEQEAGKRIMIVDDSRFIRKILQEIIRPETGLVVGGYATNGREALAKIDEVKPELILLDWDMPVMKGSTTLMHIMIRSPCPVVILSGFAGGIGANPFDLLCLGGVDFLRKPQSNWRADGRADDLVRRITDACGIKFDRIRRVKIPSPVKRPDAVAGAPVPARFLGVFFSSTGGCTDLIRTIPSLPESLPAAVLALHDMQVEAVEAFVDYLDRRSRIPVRRLQSRQPLEEGVVYVHPATVPLEVMRLGEQVTTAILPELAGVNVLDHFLLSVSRAMGENVLAVLLSGKPDVGIEGLRDVKRVGGITMVQDPASSMDPRLAEAALGAGLMDHKCPAEQLAALFASLIG